MLRSFKNLLITAAFFFFFFEGIVTLPLRGDFDPRFEYAKPQNRPDPRKEFALLRSTTQVKCGTVKYNSIELDKAAQKSCRLQLSRAKCLDIRRCLPSAKYRGNLFTAEAGSGPFLLEKLQGKYQERVALEPYVVNTVNAVVQWDLNARRCKAVGALMTNSKTRTKEKCIPIS